MKIALIISTYNNPDYLALCLKSIKRQKRKPDEVIIADDGSKTETRDLIESMRSQIPNLKHVWHEDNGFQKAKIQNLAIKESDSDYIIITDQDCILQKNFIKDHKELAEPNCFISAYRCRIKENFTKKILESSKLPSEELLLLNSKLNAKYSFRIKKLWHKNELETIQFDGTFGCNMSFWRKDFMDVNGFNEDFFGWGPEDSELTLRMMNNGVVRKKIFYSAIAFHLDHEELSKDMVPANKEIMNSTLESKSVWAKNGIDKYLKN